MSETRKIAAILVADVVGYSRLAGADEDRTLSRLRGLRSDLIDPAIAAHHGRIVKRTGDGSLIEFRSVVDAVRCAIEVQNGLVERNAGVPPEQPHRVPHRRASRRRRRGERRRSHGRRRQHRRATGEHCRAWCDLPVGGRLPSGARPGEGDVRRSRRERAQEHCAAGACLCAQGRSVGRGGLASPARRARAPPRASIAVLPFANMSGDAEQEYFADGIAEDIITALSKLGQLFVIARNSLSPSRARTSTSARSQEASACATSSKEACANRDRGSGSPRSLSMRRPAGTCGPSGSTGS